MDCSQRVWFGGLVFVPKARYPSGKGEVCKTFMRRFDPDPRLQIFNKIEALQVGGLLRCSVVPFNVLHTVP